MCANHHFFAVSPAENIGYPHATSFRDAGGPVGSGSFRHEFGAAGEQW
jgi:hypothetical protein